MCGCVRADESDAGVLTLAQALGDHMRCKEPDARSQRDACTGQFRQAVRGNSVVNSAYKKGGVSEKRGKSCVQGDCFRLGEQEKETEGENRCKHALVKDMFAFLSATNGAIRFVEMKSQPF